VDHDLEISQLKAAHEKEMNEMKASLEVRLEAAEAEHQSIIAELNARLNELEADHEKTIEELNFAHRAEVEQLQAVILQRTSKQQAKSVIFHLHPHCCLATRRDFLNCIPY
jgi:hypothetical protein